MLSPRITVVALAILETMAEVQHELRESLAYMAINAAGYHLDEFNSAVQALASRGLVTRKGHVLTITRTGLQLAAQQARRLPD
jgi:hypothetical protein